MAEIYGNNTISALLPRRVYRPNIGWRTERRFRGLMASLNAEAAAILAASPQVEIQIDPPSNDVGEGVMTVSVPDAQDGSSPDDNVHTVWGCPNSSRERVLLDSEKFLALAYSTPGDPTTPLNSDGDDLNKQFNGEVVFTAAAINAFTGDKQLFAKSIASGEKQFMSNIFTLRKSQTAPAGWTVPNLRQFVDFVFSRAQIISVFSPPANIVTQMPVTASGPPATNEGEYLCIRAELEQTDKGGWQVVLEWAHAVRWSFVYPRWT